MNCYTYQVRWLLQKGRNGIEEILRLSFSENEDADRDYTPKAVDELYTS